MKLNIQASRDAKIIVEGKEIQEIEAAILIDVVDSGKGQKSLRVKPYTFIKNKAVLSNLNSLYYDLPTDENVDPETLIDNCCAELQSKLLTLGYAVSGKNNNGGGAVVTPPNI